MPDYDIDNKRYTCLNYYYLYRYYIGLFQVNVVSKLGRDDKIKKSHFFLYLFTMVQTKTNLITVRK